MGNDASVAVAEREISAPGNRAELKVLKVKYDNVTVEKALEVAVSFLETHPKSSIFFLNLDCLNLAQQDAEYRDILNRASLVLPDGIGLKVVTALFGDRMKDNCNGSDFSPLLMRELAARGYKIFLLGGKEGVAERAAAAMKSRIPGLQIAGTHHGYFRNDEEVIDAINRSGADILFVGLGAPVQEKWIDRHRERLSPKLCLGVGALFDWLSGHKRRSPLLLRKLHLEWFWRILIEPKRMSKRYLVYGVGLLVSVVAYRIVKRKGSLSLP